MPATTECHLIRICQALQYFPRDHQMDITLKYGFPGGLRVCEESALHYHSKSIAYKN